MDYTVPDKARAKERAAPARCLDGVADTLQFEEALPLQDAWFEFQQWVDSGPSAETKRAAGMRQSAEVRGWINEPELAAGSSQCPNAPFKPPTDVSPSRWERQPDNIRFIASNPRTTFLAAAHLADKSFDGINECFQSGTIICLPSRSNLPS